jgi:uncharacterized membrane protein YfcA
MDQEILTLSVAVFAASALQSATGIGFGIIAGPVLLVVLNDSSAIQISIVLNLLIASLLAPSIRQEVHRVLLGKLLIGIGIGTPLGLLIFLSIDIDLLKAFASIIVLFTLIMVIRSNRMGAQEIENLPDQTESVVVGAVAGIMGGSLAMPGPVPAAWMAAKGFDKNTVRATILMMFVFAYALALALQFIFAEISTDTLKICASLTPATVAGILVGKFLSKRMSANIFSWLLILILAATIVILLSTIGE